MCLNAGASLVARAASWGPFGMDPFPRVISMPCEVKLKGSNTYCGHPPEVRRWDPEKYSGKIFPRKNMGPFEAQRLRPISKDPL
jgi:hypothetical protein